jgi:hypothetical protein
LSPNIYIYAWNSIMLIVCMEEKKLKVLRRIKIGLKAWPKKKKIGLKKRTDKKQYSEFTCFYKGLDLTKNLVHKECWLMVRVENGFSPKNFLNFYISLLNQLSSFFFSLSNFKFILFFQNGWPRLFSQLFFPIERIHSWFGWQQR